jgi:transcription factor 1
VQKLQLNKFYKEDVKVLDVYPNNLVFSTSLYNNLRPSQYVLMETRKDFLQHIKQYLETIKTIEHNFQLAPLDPYVWKSYLKLTEEDKTITPEFQTRDHIHTNFLFTGNVSEEGLLMQWLACLGHQNWMIKYGNVKLLLWVPEASAIKITAPPSSPARAKCSVVTQTHSYCKLIAIQSAARKKKFSAEVIERDDPLIIDGAAFSSASPMTLLEINPKDVPVNDIYSWDYVVKSLMISKTLPLIDAVNNLGPGAEQYFSQRMSKKLLQTKIKDLSSDAFLEITTHFDNWAFKPDTLFESLVSDRGL